MVHSRTAAMMRPFIAVTLRICLSIWTYIMQAPTQARFLNQPEWDILQQVYQGTLPLRYRIMITNGLGGGNRPFSIPTAAISMLTIPAAAQAAYSGLITANLGRLGAGLNALSNATGFMGIAALPSQAAGTVNLGYIVSVGPAAYPDMSINNRDLLVHELAHVWQGSNARSSTTYVANSIMNQCRSDLTIGGTKSAYDFTPGNNWRTYNAEQQASIIEKWFVDGMATSGDLWPYIRDYVRKGIV